MAEGGRNGGDHAPVMASWDDSGPKDVATPAEPEAGSATIVERARRLLRQLLARKTRDDWSPLPKL